MAIYEWSDVKYFGVVTSESDSSHPVSTPAVLTSLCIHIELAEGIRVHDRCCQIGVLLV